MLLQRTIINKENKEGCVILKKVFLSPLFKFPIPWMDDYYRNFNNLGIGWGHFIFTDENLKSKGNIKIFPMSSFEYIDLVEKKTGIKPYLPVPSRKIFDTRPAFGLIFEDYIKGCDFWGHTDFDTVLGNLDKYLTDELLSDCDLFSNDPKAVNGIFSLYRNNDFVNNLFKEHPEWIKIFQDEKHHVFEETEFSELVLKVKAEGRIRFIDRFWQEHDQQSDHRHIPKLRLEEDGSLINAVTGNEMMMFHFKITKPKYPIQ